jgi:hypothetical protein
MGRGSVTVNARPAASAPRTCDPPNAVSVTIRSGAPNQLTAIERPTATPKTRPSSCTSALAVFATPDCKCWVASSRTPTVSAIPGSNVTSAASVTTSGEACSPNHASVAAEKLAATAASGAIIGSARAARCAVIVTMPTTSPITAPASTSRQPPPRTGVTAAPASEYAPSRTYQLRWSGRARMSASRTSAPCASIRPVQHVLY